MRLLCSKAETWSEELTLEGYIVKTNLDGAPACAVHPTGIADPADCHAPIPTFWLGDTATTPPTAGIPVMGWASSYANVYEARVAALYQGDSHDHVDELWGKTVPELAIGARVRVRGTYARAFALASSGIVQQPITGVLTYQELEEIEPGPRLALPTGMNNAVDKVQTALQAHELPTRAVEGPFASLEQFCASSPDEVCELQEEELAIRLHHAVVTLGAHGEFKMVRLFAKLSGPYATYYVGLHTNAGWFVHDASWMSNENVSGAWTNSIALDSLSYRGLSPEQLHAVVIHVRQDGSSGGSIAPDDYEASTTRELLICGQGPDRRPRCSAKLTYSERTSTQGQRVDYDLLPIFDGQGEVTLSPLLKQAQVPPQVGRYTLDFSQ